MRRFTTHSSRSNTRFSNVVVTGATINGNFSTVTLAVSNPKPLSSDRLTSLIQNYNFIMMRSRKGSSLSWLRYFSITMN